MVLLFQEIIKFGLHFTFNFNDIHSSLCVNYSQSLHVRIILLVKKKSQCLQKWGGHKVPWVTVLIFEFCYILFFSKNFTKYYTIKFELHSYTSSKDRIIGTEFIFCLKQLKKKPHLNPNIWNNGSHDIGNMATKWSLT